MSIPQTKTVLFENIKARGNVARQVCISLQHHPRPFLSEILDSVEPVDDIEATSLKEVVELESDAEAIDAITECIREGIDTKMRLAVNAAKRSGVSKRTTLRIIDKYTGSNPDTHRWTYAVGERGAKIYCLLNSITTGTDPAAMTLTDATHQVAGFQVCSSTGGHLDCPGGSTTAPGHFRAVSCDCSWVNLIDLKLLIPRI